MANLIIRLATTEVARMYYNGIYIGAVVGESTIEILELFLLDFMIDVNGVRLFVDKISIKVINDIDNIISYEIENGNLKVGK